MPLSNGPSIPTSDLVFLMDPSNLLTYPGSGTTATDLVPTVAGGTMTNLTATSSSFVFGGVNSVITFPTLSANTSKVTMVARDFSISLFANTTFGASFHSWVDKFAASGYRFTVIQTGRIGLELRTQTSTYESYTTGGSVLANSTWNHIAMSWNNATKSSVFYVNGQNVAQYGAWTISPGDAGMGFNLGYAPNNGIYAKGELGPVAIYNRELSPTEMLQLQSAYRGRYNI